MGITRIDCPRCDARGGWWLDSDLAKAKTLRCDHCGYSAPVAKFAATPVAKTCQHANCGKRAKYTLVAPAVEVILGIKPAVTYVCAEHFAGKGV